MEMVEMAGTLRQVRVEMAEKEETSMVDLRAQLQEDHGYTGPSINAYTQALQLSLFRQIVFLVLRGGVRC